MREKSLEESALKETGTHPVNTTKRIKESTYDSKNLATIPEEGIHNQIAIVKETEKRTDSIKVKISFKSYVNSKNDDGIGIGSTIKSKDSFININTMFESFSSFAVKKSKLPLKLIINEKYKITKK